MDITTRIEAAAPLLSAKGIRKSFGPLQVLHGIDVEARSGDIISLIGASGSGKSTFLRCLNLLEQPDSGSIMLDGSTFDFGEVKQTPSKASARALSTLRASMTMVFQNFNLWSHLTVIDNVMIAPMKVLGLSKAEATERAKQYLTKVGIYDKKDRYPAHISGGQQQRVAIARALAMHPKVLLFDEPTSALDPELVGEVLMVMRKLAEEGRTMLVVTHEMAFARDVSSHVMFLRSGHIEEQGHPAEMFGSPKSPYLRSFTKKSS